MSYDGNVLVSLAHAIWANANYRAAGEYTNEKKLIHFSNH